MSKDVKQEDFSQAVQAQVHKIMHDFNLRIEPKEWKLEMERQKQELSEKWNLVYQEIPSSIREELPSHYLEKFPRLFSFGYSLGYQISEILGGRSSENHEAGVASALFNLYASLFDEICDNYPHLVSRLTEIVNVESLAKVIDAGEKLDTCVPLTVSDRDDILLKTVCLIMNQYFAKCRIQKSINSRTYEDFQNLILDIYKMELQSLRCTFASGTNSADIYRILFTKSALPSWAIFLTSFMCLKREPTCNLVELKNAIVGLGKAIWIVDDLSDIFEDLDRNRWSYVWLKLHLEHRVPLLHNDGKVRNKTELCEDLLATSVVSDSTAEMCKSLVDSFALLRRHGYDVAKFERNIIVWINSWIG